MAHILRSLVIRRVGTYLADIALLFALLWPIGLVVQHILDIRPRTGPEIGLAIIANFSLPAWLYFWLSDRSARGATIGKRLLRLAVRDRAAERLGAVLATSGRESVHDWVAGTHVCSN